MRGRLYATDGTLAEADLYDLTDLLACRLFQKLGRRAYLLGRDDVRELIRPYIDDLSAADQQTVPWMVWDLLQEGMELEFEAA